MITPDVMPESDSIISNRSHATHPTSGGGTGSANGSNANNDGSANTSPPNITFISGVSLPDHLLRDATTSLQGARQDGFDYVVTALPDGLPFLSSAGGGSASKKGGVDVPQQLDRRTDVTRLGSKWWSTSIVGMIADPRHWNDVNSNSSTNNNSAGGAASSAHTGRKLMEALTNPTSPLKDEATKIFYGMMEWASHMNIPAVILPSILPITQNDGDAEKDSINCPAAKEYARLLAQLSTSGVCASSHVQLWIRVPLTVRDLQAYQLLLARCDGAMSVGCMIYAHEKLDAADLPSLVRALHLVLGGGNVKAVSWDTSVFLKNKRGYPTLSKSHQFVFSMLFGRLGRTLRTLVEGNVVESGMQASATGRLHHLQYLRHLRSRPPLLEKLDTEECVLETPYLDSLQSPLQPLGDHLEYQTYETFEKDPVKYERYGQAIEYALADGLNAQKYAALGTTRTTLTQLKRTCGPAFDIFNSEVENHNVPIEVGVHRVTILVVGAGRGPLVREAIGAVARVSAEWIRNSQAKALHARIVAIEKNPSAVLYLRSLKATEPSWNGGQDYDPSIEERGGTAGTMEEGNLVLPGTSNVTVIGCDMREATSHPALRNMMQNAKSRANIVVSELLGSFGDNELSPECLDGVQRCGILKDDCVSIPQSYTAYIAPVSSARLHSEAKTQACLPVDTSQGPLSPPVGMQRAMETPYVVRSHAASQTHEEQECWVYSHPHPIKGTNVSASLNENSDHDMMDTTTSIDDNLLKLPSARAAENINNDRHAYISFQDTTPASHGAGIGCGYGAVDPDTASLSTADGPGSGPTDATMTVHGFLGSFHSVLYKSKAGEGSSVISIAPNTFSVGMFSWFPLYFPLKEPLRVPPGATLDCNIWRRSDEGRVWYEWCAEVLYDNDGMGETILWGASPIHNPGGRSYHVKK